MAIVLTVVAASICLWTSLTYPARAQQDRQAPENLQNVIRWSTASEVDNFGFDVYRAEQEEGPFERITPQPIPGAGTSDEPARYEYVDDTIKVGVQYYYYVESIAMNGTREKFTPIFKAPVKSASSSPSRSEGQ